MVALVIAVDILIGVFIGFNMGYNARKEKEYKKKGKEIKMVQVHSYKNAIDLMYRLLGGEERGYYFKKNGKPIPSDKVYNLMDVISENHALCENLNFYLNQKFPHGTDENEYEDFFVNHWKEIQTKLAISDEEIS